MNRFKVGGALVAVAVLVAACSRGDGTGTAAGDAAQDRTDGEAASATTEPDETALRADLDQWRSDVNAFGATLSVRVPGHRDVHVASGVDDRDPDTPMPTGGTYAVVSVTKTFVAATALQLVEEGRLSLDEPVAPWLPELPHADRISLAMLLGHTSGLGEWEWGFEDLRRSFTPDELLAEHGKAPPFGEPGEHFAYTNAGYVAAGLLIERELDQDLAAVIEDRFTGPLSLDDTWPWDLVAKPTRRGWFSLDPDDPNRPLDYLDLVFEAAITSSWASSNLASSSSDLLDWGEALYSGDVLGDELTATMLDMRSPFTPDPATDRFVATDTSTPLHYGLGAMGFCLDQTGCSPDQVDLVGHSGRADGTRALLAHHPDSGTTIAVHANVGEIDLPQLIALLPEVLQELGLGTETGDDGS